MPRLLPLLALALWPLASAAQVAPDRALEPVVVTGADAAPLLGQAPEAVVAFRWTGAGWAQVPVQVDERAVVDIGRAYGSINIFACEFFFFCTDLRGQVETLFWTDEDTFLGGDPDAEVDADDEIAMIAGDAGARAPGSAAPPASTRPGTLAEVRLSGASGDAYLYLAASDGTLDPSAGQDRVRYRFGLLSGDYKATYDRTGSFANGGAPVGDALGVNPEDTTVETDQYGLHYSDRWILDGLTLGTSPDLLDRRKVLFSPGECDRHETTGSRGEGAFVVNRDGPVRAIRSVIGFNSGPLTQRTDVFWPGRWESTTDLRVHSIPGILDVMDYTAAATGMTYLPSTAAAEVVIDGDPDPGVRGGSPLAWEVVRGADGALVIRHEIEGATPTAYYADNDTSPPVQCTGDADAFGQTGPWIPEEIPSTDPRLGSSRVLRATRTTVLTPDALTAPEAQAVLARLDAPLAVSVAPFEPTPGGGLTATLTPTGATDFPASGGTLRFETALTNGGAAPVTTETWTIALLPNGGTRNVVRRQTVTVAPGETVTRAYSVRVKPNVPAGSYTLSFRAGTFPDGVEASDTFGVTKSGAAALSASLPEDALLATAADGASGAAPEAALAVWPNPSASRATAEFRLDAAGPVRLSVLDALGREVLVAARGHRAAGPHTAALDLDTLAPGVYRVRLQTASGVAVRALTRL